MEGEDAIKGDALKANRREGSSNKGEKSVGREATEENMRDENARKEKRPETMSAQISLSNLDVSLPRHVYLYTSRLILMY